jgi:hypothetical protein
VVVLYSAAVMLRSAASERRKSYTAEPTQAASEATIGR